MADTKLQRTAGGWREYSGNYQHQEGDVKRLGFAWFIFSNGKWRKLSKKEVKTRCKTNGKSIILT